ncbi:excitatory amino acid transporter 3 [Fopius arisanus]|uniref:Amino acid transporter n=1 Tax=Fopius arisanus TaxID=64838 RepID=A0A0C9R1I2_9HYME|nr:PREDICTED: excitatory amino acid transporter 3-like [Fopius arisanus]
MKVSEKHSTIFTLIGVICGFIIGIILKSFTSQPWADRNIMYFQFPGELFLRSVNCLIIPLIVSSIVSATCRVSDSGSIGIKAAMYYFTTTTLGITLSVLLAVTIQPGRFHKIQNEGFQFSQEFVTTDTFLDLIRNLVTDNLVKSCMYQYQTVLINRENVTDDSQEGDIYSWVISHKDNPGTNVLGLVGFSLLLGVAIGRTKDQGKPLLDFFRTLSDVSMMVMDSIIMVVPIGVLFLIPAKILQTEDIGGMMSRLGVYIATVFLGLLIHGLIVLPTVYFICTRKSPFTILSKIGPAIITAIGTSSSTATVPVTLKCLDGLNINRKVSRFMVPIGATINMDGIALYETIGALFIIQLRGLEFSLPGVIAIAITCTVSCIGAAGLPNGGYVMLIVVLQSIGIPAEDVTLIITIDCFVDRIRTTVNIIADALGSSLVSHFTEPEEVDSEHEAEEFLRDFPLENSKL